MYYFVCALYIQVILQMHVLILLIHMLNLEKQFQHPEREWRALEVV